MLPLATQLPRLATGIGGLDYVTGGGLPRGEVTLLAGAAGTGKSVLAAQFLANGIMHSSEPGVFVTLEESPEKIRRFITTFGWDVDAWERQRAWAFVDASIGDVEEIVVGDDFDLTGLVARIASTVADIGAKRVVIESVSHVLARLGDAPRVRAQLHRFITALDALDVTTVITAERDHHYNGIARFGVEEFVADNMVILRNSLEAERRRRTIEVLKFRGAPHRSGEFPFAILPEEGVAVVALSAVELNEPTSQTRVSLGNVEIDAMCGGGLFQGCAVLISGPTGSGKSLLTLEFVTAGHAERGLFVAFEESAAQLTRNARNWGHDLAALETSGRLRLLAQYPESAPLEAHLLRIQRAVDEFRPTRVVLDSLSGIGRSAPARDFHEFLLGLASFLKGREITTVFTTTNEALLGGASASGIEASTLLDTIIVLRYVEVYGEVRRGIAVLKMRGSDHDKAIREFTIGDRGTRLGPPFRTTTGILAGQSLQLLGAEKARVDALYTADEGT
jgi:circadian clock protein KaiC